MDWFYLRHSSAGVPFAGGSGERVPMREHFQLHVGGGEPDRWPGTVPLRKGVSAAGGPGGKARRRRGLCGAGQNLSGSQLYAGRVHWGTCGEAEPEPLLFQHPVPEKDREIPPAVPDGLPDGACLPAHDRARVFSREGGPVHWVSGHFQLFTDVQKALRRFPPGIQQTTNGKGGVPLKFIRTFDWHLGRMLYGRSQRPTVAGVSAR